MEQLLRDNQRSSRDVADLLDKLDYCNAELLRHNLDHGDHSTAPNTVITTVYIIYTFAATFYYRAMHFSAYARSWDRMSSVRPSVRLSVRL